MTPKEEAKHLAIKFTSITDVVRPNIGSIRMALLCVDEKIASVIRIKHPMNTNRMNRRVDRIVSELEEVKQEINKL
jgi:hypothetical protein